MTHELTREYKRSQFMSSAVHSAERLLTRTNPALAGAKAVANKISAHASRLDQLQRTLEGAVGAKTSNNRQRMLTQNRKLVMGALQHDEGLAKFIDLTAPVCDASKCTMCGDCAKVCTTRALDLDVNGHITIQASYCVSCGACVKVCEDGALAMEPMDVTELIVPDLLPRSSRARRPRQRPRRRSTLNKAKSS